MRSEIGVSRIIRLCKANGFCVFLSIVALSGTTNTVSGENLLSSSFFYNSIDDANELPHITSMNQSPDGIIWLGMYDGLAWYDGYEFHKVDGLVTNNKSNSTIDVTTIENSTRGTLLIPTGGELLEVNPLTKSATTLLTHSNSSIFCVLEIGESILVGTDNGLFEHNRRALDQATQISNSEDLKIVDIAKTPLGKIYVASNSGLYLLSDSSLQKIGDYPSRHLTISGEDTWVSALKFGLKLVDSKGKEIESIAHGPDTGMQGSETITSFLDHQGKLWIGTDRGITVLHPEGPIENIAESLDHDQVKFIFEDLSKNIWIGTPVGISRYSPRLTVFPKFDRSTKNHKISHDSIIAFNEDNDSNVWIGTYDGLTKWDRPTNTFQHFSAESLRLPDAKIMSIDTHDHRLFVGTMRGGMSVVDSESMISSKHYSSESTGAKRIPSNAISAIETHQGTTIVGTYGQGIFLFEKEGDQPDKRVIDLKKKLAGTRVIDIEVDENNGVWIATQQNGIYGYSDITLKKQEEIEDESKTIHLSGYETSTIRSHKNSLWIGTPNIGVVKYNLRTLDSETFSSKEGLPSNVIYSIEIDNENHVWISTTRGLSRLNPETGEIRNFNTSHGLQGDDFNGNASIKLSDGTLLFGGNNGFNAFDPSKIAFNDYQGQTLITTFSKMNQPQPGRFLSDGSETIQLSYKENVFSFEFALMDFTAPEDNTFEYQLVGFDEGWINSGKRNNVSYTNLDAGDYEFRVRGFNNDGVVTDKIASIHVSVAPPPWRTWYAYLAYALITIILFVTAFRLYTSRVIRITNEKRNAEERQRLEALVAERTTELNEKIKEQAITLQQKEIANKEIHHRVKNNLQVILGLLTLQAETEENEHFQTAMNEIRQRITSMSLIHKSLYEHTVATIDIKQYAENLINSIRQFHPDVANGNIEVILEVGNETLDIDTALPVGLVLNELITNCLKHGFANLQPGSDLNIIKVTFQREDGNYVMTVTDNGTGLPGDFDIDSPSSMGSELILIFAQQLDGQISAENLVTGGASFTLSFPAPEVKQL